VKGRAQVDGDDGVPLVDRELLDRRDVLDAGVVDQDVDRPESPSADFNIASMASGFDMSAASYCTSM